MTITSQTNPITITDEHDKSVGGIPVIVKDGIAYGDNDIVEEIGAEYGDGHVNHSVWIGKIAKRDVAQREYKDNADIFNWIVQGTGLESHAAYMARIQAEHQSMVGLIWES